MNHGENFLYFFVNNKQQTIVKNDSLILNY